MQTKNIPLEIANAYQVDLYNISKGHPFCFISDWHIEMFRAESALKVAKKLLKSKGTKRKL